jgi:hypothetical protein
MDGEMQDKRERCMEERAGVMGEGGEADDWRRSLGALIRNPEHMTCVQAWSLERA